MADFFAFFVVLFLCFILDLIFFPVICLFQDVSAWKLRKIVRDLPQAQKGNSYLLKEARTIKNIVFTGLFFSCLVAVAILWILFGFGITFKGALDLYMLILLSLILIANRANSYLRSYAKAEGEFLVIGRLELILKIVTPALTIPGVIFLKIKGILLAMLLIEILSVSYYVFRLKKLEFHFFLNFRKTLTLLQTGFMIFINKISESIFWSVGLMITAALMTTENVGLYNIALAAMLIVEPFSQAINMTVYRKIMVDGGKYGTDSPEPFREYTQGFLVIYVMLTSLILGVFIFLYMVVIRTILTEYVESLPIMIILAFGYMVYASRIFMSYYLNVTNQLIKRLIIITSGLAVNALLSYLAIKLGYGIQGVAVSCSISFVFIAFVIMVISFKQIHGNIKSSLTFLIKIFSISAILTGAIIFFERWNFFNYMASSQITNQLLLGTSDFFIKSLFFACVCIGLYFISFKQYQLYKELKPMILYVWYSFINRFQINKKAVNDV